MLLFKGVALKGSRSIESPIGSELPKQIALTLSASKSSSTDTQHLQRLLAPFEDSIHSDQMCEEGQPGPPQKKLQRCRRLCKPQ